MFINDGYYSAEDRLTVCTTHRRFVPCRKRDGCRFSSDPKDVESVRQYQAGADTETLKRSEFRTGNDR